MSRRLYLAFLALILAAIAWKVWPRHAPAERITVRRLAPGTVLPGASRLPAHGNPNPPAPDEPPIADAPSQLADRLNAPDGDIHADLRQLNDIFVAYRGATHVDDPVGDNADITEVLSGRNKLGFAFIPKDHPAINADGELCDRWGTPFFFHQLSGDEMEIRSAGPDHKLWTADDEVLSP